MFCSNCERPMNPGELGYALCRVCEAANLKANIEYLQGQLDKSRAESDERYAEIERLKTELAETEKKRAFATVLSNRHLEEIHELKDELQAEIERWREAQAEIERLKIELKTWRRSSKEWQDKYLKSNHHLSTEGKSDSIVLKERETKTGPPGP